jgi:uncharacterized membrane-anchored protein
LNDEAHARPPEALTAPVRITFVALADDGIQRALHEAPVHELCRRMGRPPPLVGANHASLDLGAFRMKWEKHTEFTRYKFIVPGDGAAPFSKNALDAVPKDWLESLPGKLIAATHVEFLKGRTDALDIDGLAHQHFSGNVLVGAAVADGAAQAFSDFRIREDGCGRLIIFDHGLTPRQAGRCVQRLLEIDAYRILALLALPLAREIGPLIDETERELADVTSKLSTGETTDEAGLLDRLTNLEAQIQQRLFKTAPRFGASEAYHRLIQQRIEELRERRIGGVQTFRQFIERRLSPAISTCVATSTRQERLSSRVADATELLSTRVAVARERQSQEVLESMNRRALLQLRMQQTVEGLSVAAITYYVAGLIAYVVKGLASAGAAVSPDVVVAISIPLVAVLVAIAVRRIRHFIVPHRHDG